MKRSYSEGCITYFRQSASCDALHKKRREIRHSGSTEKEFSNDEFFTNTSLVSNARAVCNFACLMRALLTRRNILLRKLKQNKMSRLVRKARSVWCQEDRTDRMVAKYA